jgi:hypothetical protein
MRRGSIAALLLDEPSAGLVPLFIDAMFEQVQAINRAGEMNAGIATLVAPCPPEAYSSHQAAIVSRSPSACRTLATVANSGLPSGDSALQSFGGSRFIRRSGDTSVSEPPRLRGRDELDERAAALRRRDPD